jgi:hypothetical protein
MDEVIRQCSEAGLVSGRHLSVDGTEVQADASVKSLTRRGPCGPDDQDPPQDSRRNWRAQAGGRVEGAWPALYERDAFLAH